MVNISDVARKAGLSVSTVSRVLNHKPHVSPQKEILVKEAMADLGYRPMTAARQLRGSNARTLAVTVPRITNPFFANLVDMIEQVLDQAGYTTVLIQTFGRGDKELAALDLLQSQSVEGVILCSIENEPELIQSYNKFGQLLLVNEYRSDLQLPTVRADQYQGFRRATLKLLDRGYRRIAYVTGHHQEAVSTKVTANLNHDRLTGYQAALRARGQVWDPDLMFTQVKTATEGKKLLQDIWQQPVRPDAIISGSDEVAIGILEAARVQGIRVPQELGVLGVDDQPLSNDLFIPLTTLQQPTTQLGSAAAQTMLQLLQGEKVAQEQVFDLRLVLRQSI
ncbi:LacI family DNA-binding transcriptional regulator [Lactobacillus sp. DCY120]|uniref:LacI family DNA-binding transcriptional regulator n=1 Tax=Bombilactobacillus apium TaxID=2675299 RepID=A0A850RB19_9LACO|nr:LacI family DNA-binding transcriptional regulator [Bombilactobacillus apium]NVY96008.1 LacI family DNA-binding transcriptional regulator [Bombilactobacillus apium]